MWIGVCPLVPKVECTLAIISLSIIHLFILTPSFDCGSRCLKFILQALTWVSVVVGGACFCLPCSLSSISRTRYVRSSRLYANCLVTSGNCCETIAVLSVYKCIGRSVERIFVSQYDGSVDEVQLRVDYCSLRNTSSCDLKIMICSDPWST